MKYVWKFLIAVFYDILDMFIGRIPVVGFFYDLIGGIIMGKLFGTIGYLVWAEMFEITDQFDAWIPSASIVALISRYK